MKSDEHNKLVYTNFIKDLNFFLDDHVLDCCDRPLKDVAKIVMQIVKDPECKYLRPTKSTTESSDDDFPMQFEIIEEDQILTAFPDQILTSKVHE